MSMTFNTDVVVGSSYNLDIQGLKIFYGTSSTAAATTAKTVTCDGFTSTDLAAGTIIFVKFANTNSGAVGSLTMAVNGTTAKSIKRIYNGAISNLNAAGDLLAGVPIPFCYDGTQWVIITPQQYNTSYSTMSAAEAQAGTATSNRVIRPDRLAAGIKRQACFKTTLSSISSLPKTFTVTGLTANHEVIRSILSVPSAQGSDWTITTAANQVTVSGTFSGSTATDLTLYFGIPETVTATAQ